MYPFGSCHGVRTGRLGAEGCSEETWHVQRNYRQVVYIWIEQDLSFCMLGCDFDFDFGLLENCAVDPPCANISYRSATTRSDKML